MNTELSPQELHTGRGNRVAMRSLRVLATRLLDQQLWCWGQDVRRVEGNALLDYGFTRVRPPDGKVGSTTYAMQLDGGYRIALWGFGFFFAHSALGGIFVRRFGFSPRFTPAADLVMPVWSLEHLPHLTRPVTADQRNATRDLLVSALRWIAAYEQWAVASLGLEYRQQCLAAWWKAVVPAHWFATEWLRLADALETGC